jgi:hypothetical protein
MNFMLQTLRPLIYSFLVSAPIQFLSSEILYHTKQSKVFLCLINYGPHHEDVWDCGSVALPSLTSTLGRGELSATRPPPPPPERAPGTDWIGGWGGTEWVWKHGIILQK